MSAPWYLRIGANTAQTRLRYLRGRAESGAATWREARVYTLNNWAAAHCELDQGFNGTDAHKVPIWYCHTGPQFRNERYCDEALPHIRGRCWFTDPHQDSSARGIIANLTHGRFIAGYEWSSNDERTYFGDVFTDEADAARMADEHARVFAERQYEDEARYQAAWNLDFERTELTRRLRECLALRNNPCFKALRVEAASTIARIREIGDTLTSDYGDVSL